MSDHDELFGHVYLLQAVTEDGAPHRNFKSARVSFEFEARNRYDVICGYGNAISMALVERSLGSAFSSGGPRALFKTARELANVPEFSPRAVIGTFAASRSVRIRPERKHVLPGPVS